jgi:Ser/Thr protein kinase RdoA (MazF antagonist)
MQFDGEQLKREIAERYTLANMGAWTQIINGDECLVWRVENGDSPLIVRVSPTWRTVDELQWVHDFTVYCGRTIREVVAPIAARDASTLFVFESYPVTVFPFVEGDSTNTDDAILREKAARLLTHIHKATVTWADKRPRPASKANKPQPLAREQYPDVFNDAAFDAWEQSLPQLGLTIAPIHGDYYSRNVLATATRITGVIDWDEAHIAYLMAEIGWSAWEFCQNDAGDDLHDDRVRDFLNAYFDENPPCPRSEIDHAINFIRLRLRNEAVSDLARQARGEVWDMEYTEAEMRAFATLHGRKLT